jgi:hypothetical protein
MSAIVPWLALAVTVWLVTKAVALVVMSLVSRKNKLLRIIGVVIGVIVVGDCVYTGAKAFFDHNLTWIEVAFTAVIYGYVAQSIAIATFVALIMAPSEHAREVGSA